MELCGFLEAVSDEDTAVPVTQVTGLRGLLVCHVPEVA